MTYRRDPSGAVVVNVVVVAVVVVAVFVAAVVVVVVVVAATDQTAAQLEANERAVGATFFPRGSNRSLRVT